MKEIEILKLDYFGRGIGYMDGKVTFVLHALPNELVKVVLIKEKKKYQVGKVEEVIRANSSREESLCPYFDLFCGGCQLRHMNKVAQREFKINRVKDLLLQNAKIERSDFKFLEGVSNDYRNKVVFHINGKEFGFYQEETEKLISIDFCYLLDNQINQLLPLLKELLNRPHQLERVMIRVGVNTNGSMVSFYGEVNASDIKNVFFGKVSTALLNDDILWGEGVIMEEILGKLFLLSPQSFFQVNTKQVELLYQEALSSLEEKHIHTLLDLYSGTGTIGILASSKVDKVIGVEVVESAVLDARKNAKMNQVDNIEFFCGKVEDILFSKTFPQVDAVIIDPPRRGLKRCY